MHLAATSMRQAIQGQLATYGHQITMPRWHILNRLWEEESLTQNDLAERTFRDKTTTARTVSLREAQQLIVRRRDPTDQRNYQVFLTPSGRVLKDQLIPLASAVVDQACTGLSDDQVTALKAMLAAIHANFGHEPDGAPLPDER